MTASESVIFAAARAQVLAQRRPAERRRGCIPEAAIALLGILATLKHGPVMGLYTLAALASLLWVARVERDCGRPLWPLLPRRHA